jgi:hypothetical protein
LSRAQGLEMAHSRTLDAIRSLVDAGDAAVAQVAMDGDAHMRWLLSTVAGVRKRFDVDDDTTDAGHLVLPVYLPPRACTMTALRRRQ